MKHILIVGEGTEWERGVNLAQLAEYSVLDTANGKAYYVRLAGTHGVHIPVESAEGKAFKAYVDAARLAVVQE